jgi:hypothetical protein
MRRICDWLASALVALCVFLACFAFSQGPAQGSVQVLGAESISLGTTLIGEGDDFATRVLGLPWDMSKAPYPDYPTTFTNFNRGTFSMAGGIWTIQGDSDPYIWFLNPGIANAQKVLRLGDQYPIDADKYRLFSAKLCSDTADSGVVYWYLDQFGADPLRIGYWDPPFAVEAGCKLYVIDLFSIDHQQNYAWSGMIKGFRLDPVNFISSATIDLDWARLTTADTTNIVPIEWTNVISGTNLHFFLNDHCSITDAMPIGIVAREGNESGTFNWGASLLANGDPSTPYPLPESFQPGTYTALMQIDGVGDPICAAETLEIRKAPILSIQKPSMFSGPDYATEVVGDPWGMANSEDILMTNDITSSVFAGGIWDATSNTGGDPWAHMNVSTSIDTGAYKYVTMRMWLEGQAQGIQQFVSIHRWIWWYTNPAVDAVTTEEMLIKEGWQTYSFDLSQACIDPVSPPGSGWSGNPIVFRNDIHEESQAMDFHIDFITLTGDEIISSGDIFSIVYELDSESSVDMAFYYDTDCDPDNGGRVLMTQHTRGPNILFFPVVGKDLIPANSAQPELNLLTGSYWDWDTASVPAGTYFVSIDVSDGINTTTWYSEVPVIIQ